MGNKKVIYIVGIECATEVEEQYNKWMDEIHIPMVLKNRKLKRITRYKRLGADKKYPGYMNLLEFDSREDLESYIASPENTAATEEAESRWHKGDREIPWRVRYEAIQTW